MTLIDFASYHGSKYHEKYQVLTAHRRADRSRPKGQGLKPKFLVKIDRWSVEEEPQFHELLLKESLTDAEKERVLVALDGYFQELQQTAGYKSRDLLVLHSQVPNLDGMLSKFDQIHTHADDEVRYVIAGEGVFGFVRPDSSQVELTVQAEEYINVPAGTEHWFHLTPTRRIKAVRYFSGAEGWVPQYTDRKIRFPQLSVNS